MKRWTLSLCLGAVAIASALGLSRCSNDGTTNLEGASQHVAVTANAYASNAALEVLRENGSAVDAAIAAELVLTLVEPQSSGIGGGLFMLVSDPKGQMRVYDGREVAPAQFSPETFLDGTGKAKRRDAISTGGLSVGVPGAIAAMWIAHQRHGRRPWKSLFRPAITLADQGFVVTPLLARAIGELRQETLDGSMKAIYFHRDGKQVRAGETIKDAEYAKTLRLIAEQGPSGFYEGKVANAIVEAVRSSTNRGVMTFEDVSAYRAIEREPLCGRYRSYRICTTPAPSGGPTVLQILGILNRFNPDLLLTGSFSQVHYFTQASRLAYADRAMWLGDPDHISVPQAGLLDSGYLALRAKSITGDRDMGSVESGVPPARGALNKFAPQRSAVGHGTSHLSIIDRYGYVVSMTASIQASFGAQIRAAGFVLNNELTDFSLEPEIGGRMVANAPGPSKRPLSAMSPTIVFGKGGFFAAIGSPGGPDIISYNAQALIDLIDGGNSVATAVANPHFTNLNGSTILEMRPSTLLLVPQLLIAGHSVRVRPLESGLNGIRNDGGKYSAATDVRGEGAARGE